MRSQAPAALAAVCAALALAAPAQADPPPPQLGAGCAADLADALTLLPDLKTYAMCRGDAGGYMWTAAAVPFDPQDSWYSYGPVITLHGQGMRNPNVTAGQWTATPRDPQTACRASQQTVVEAGVLSEPDVIEGQPGQPVPLELQPKLFYLELSGDCLWQKQ